MIRVRQVKVDIDKKSKNEIVRKTALKLKIKENDILDLKIVKESIDARKKDNIQYVYEVDINVLNEIKILNKNKSNDVLKSEKKDYQFKITGDKVLKNRPIIVGSGPSGLFAAYFLASHGYKPIIIERGKKVEDRVLDVENFWKTGKLNTNSNVQFGEGGAGTFSDGKLGTLVKDKENRCQKVFEIFVQNGADEDILYVNKPHIGTDLLRTVIKNMRNQIINMGGTFKYNTILTDLIIKDDKLESIVVNNNEKINTYILILAIGHSARDTFKMLYEHHLKMQAKPFAVGIRIMHPQEMIDISQYGASNILPPASYKLTYQATNNRGVYSFCMCPGGYVVNASSENNMLAINGMSNHNRDSDVANSAIVVTVSPNDYGDHPLDGIEFQRKLENKTYQVGSGKIPIQLYKDFKQNKLSTEFGTFEPKLKGKYEFSNLNNIFPPYIIESLKEAIEYYDKKIKGFNRGDAVLAAIESRTSSPVRIERNEFFESNIKGIYPIGEGAGYAGGITTSAMDGIKVAEAIAKVYKP